MAPGARLHGKIIPGSRGESRKIPPFLGGFLHLKLGLSEALVQNSSFTVTAAPAN